jgi:hypothetical protein
MMAGARRIASILKNVIRPEMQNAKLCALLFCEFESCE